MSNVPEVSKKPKFSVAIQTDKYQKLINNTLSDPERAKRFIASISSAVAINKDLQDCDAGTILSGALLGEALNLSPSPQLGHYYLLPFNSKSAGKVAIFVLGYKGYLNLLLRSGIYEKVNVMEVKDGELISYDPFNDDIRLKYIENEETRENKETIGYYAMFQEKNGGIKKILYWSKAKMINHADKYSPAFSKQGYELYIAGKVKESDMWKYSSFWYKDFDSMAKKTMLRQLISKWGVMSIDMQQAYEKDNQVLFGDGNSKYLDDSEEPTPEAIPEEIPEAIIKEKSTKVDINEL